jgi:hypothetical protein
VFDQTGRFPYRRSPGFPFQRHDGPQLFVYPAVVDEW